MPRKRWKGDWRGFAAWLLLTLALGSSAGCAQSWYEAYRADLNRADHDGAEPTATPDAAVAFRPASAPVIREKVLRDVVAGRTESATPTIASSPGSAQSPLSAALNTLFVRASSGGALQDQPLQFGRPFRTSEIANCPQLTLDGKPIATQADVKTRYDDGSVRFSVVSAILPSVSERGSTLGFVDAPCSKPSLAKVSELLGDGYNFDAVVELNGGSAGVASARDLVARKRFSLWTNGPVVTTAIVADHAGKSADLGTDAHKSVRPSFEVQFWPSLKLVRARVVMETTDVEKIQNQHYAVSIRLGHRAPREAYRNDSVEHAYMTRWTKVFWNGTPPAELDIDYNVGYLASTQAIPNYDASIRLSPSTRSAIVSGWQKAKKDIYEPGMWTRAMHTTGGRADIGPYPKWAVAWLYDGSAALRQVALGQADLAGAWPVHLREGSAEKRLVRGRDERALGMPVSGYARPTLAMADLRYEWTDREDRANVVGKADSGGWHADVAHQPQPFFLPYLLTGEHFYLEQMQFWAGFALLDNAWGGYGRSCTSRSVSNSYMGFGETRQVRSTAWGLRMLAEAAWATPEDSDGYKNYLRTAYEDVITRLEGRRGVVRGTNKNRPDWQWAKSKGDCSDGALSTQNPLHYWGTGNQAYGSNASVKRYGATWQYGFVMYALNRGVELGLPASALRDWFAHFFVSAVTEQGEIPYHLADYTLPVIDADTGDFYQNWSAVHLEYRDYAGAKSWPPNTKPDSNSKNSLDQGYATVALAALASTAGIFGSAKIWDGFAKRHYNAWGWERDPKWAIVPRADEAVAKPGVASRSLFGRMVTASPLPIAEKSISAPRPLPSWASTLPLHQWHEIPGTELQRSDAWTSYKGSKGGSKAGILAFSGGAIKTSGSELFIAGGGHTDYSGNEVFSIVLGAEHPKWVRRIDPSVAPPLPDKNIPYYEDGRPASRHTYWTLQFIDQRNLLVFFGAPALWARNGRSEDVVDAFDPEKNDYLPAGTLLGYPGIGNYATGIAKDAEGNVYVHITRTGELVRWNQQSNTWTSLGKKGQYQYETPYAIDTRRNRMVRMANGKTSAAYFDLTRNGTRVDIVVKGAAAQQVGNVGQLVYDPGADVFWFWKRGDSELYRIDPETWEATLQPVSGTAPNNTRLTSKHNTYGRFSYAPELGGLIFMRDHTSNIYFNRTSR